MPRLSYKAKMIIGMNLDMPSRQLADELEKTEGVSYSHMAIYNYQKSMSPKPNFTNYTNVTNVKSTVTTSDKKDEVTKQQPTPQQIIQVTQVIQCLHINANKKQREALTALLGSYDVNTVRHWLLAQYQELLG